MSGSSASWPTARSSSSKAPGRLGRAVQGIVLPIIVRWVITDRPLAWMYDHRVARPATDGV